MHACSTRSAHTQPLAPGDQPCKTWTPVVSQHAQLARSVDISNTETYRLSHQYLSRSTMQRGTQLCIVCILLFVCQCAAQGGSGRGKAKAAYAHPRSFSQWDHRLDKDPLVLVAFITAIIAGTLRMPVCINSHALNTVTAVPALLAESVNTLCPLQCLGSCLSCGNWCTTISMQQPSASGCAARDL